MCGPSPPLPTAYRSAGVAERAALLWAREVQSGRPRFWRVVLALGELASHRILGLDEPMERMRGDAHQWEGLWAVGTAYHQGGVASWGSVARPPGGMPVAGAAGRRPYSQESLGKDSRRISTTSSFEQGLKGQPR